jgi:hypothetical protein
MKKAFLTKVREQDGVVRAEVHDRDDLSRGALAAIAYVRSESGTLAVQELRPLIPGVRSADRVCAPPESAVVPLAGAAIGDEDDEPASQSG